MKKIPLTQGKFAIVDDEDFERLNQYKWHILKGGRTTYYAIRGKNINKKTKIYYMHREIMNIVDNKIQIDHINGNGLDNSKSNLRCASNQQNAMNRRNHCFAKKLKIKGVHCHENIKKFHAEIMLNSKSIHLGYFNVLGDADSAYRKAEKQYFGEFARV